MKNYEMKFFITYLLFVNFFLIHDSFYVNSLKLTLQQDNSNSNNSDEKIQNEILEKIGKEPNLDKLDLKSIDENNLNDLINKKSTEIEEEAKSADKEGFAGGILKTLSSLGGDKINLKLEDLKIESDIQNQSCEQIKNMGKQKEFCESKFLLQKGEEKTVDCLKNFCGTCCEEDQSCIETCRRTHAINVKEDPEDMFMDVCSYKSMGSSFHGFCETMLTEKNKGDYEECFKNFCFDCCSNELKITDFNDIGMQKCMKICQPPNNLDNPPTDSSQSENESINESSDAKTENENSDKSVDPEKKDLNDLLAEKANENQEILKNNEISNEENDNNRDDSDDGNVKVLVDFSKKNVNDNSKTKEKVEIDNDNESAKEFLKKEFENDHEILNKKQNKTASNINEKTQISEGLNKVVINNNLNNKNITKNLQNKPSNKNVEGNELDKKQVKESEKTNEVEEELEIEKYEKSKRLGIQKVKGEKTKGITKICDDLLLSNSNIKTFGFNINKLCEVNFKLNSYNSKKECIENLCSPCCKILNGDENDKQRCKGQCLEEIKEEIDILKVKPYIRDDLNTKDKEIQNKKANKIKKTKSEILEIKKLDESYKNFIRKEKHREKGKENFNDQTKDIENSYTISSSLNEDPSDHHINFISHSNKNSTNVENLIKLNIKINEYFSIIHNICKIDYFKDCNELLCSDFCLNADTENIKNCHLDCKKSIFSQESDSKTGELVELIIKRYLLYKNKNDILFDNNNNLKQDFSNPNLEINKISKNDVNSNENGNTIENVKKRIDELRKNLLEEETNLLNLYKLKG